MGNVAVLLVELFQSQGSLSVTLKHLVKCAFVFSFMKLQSLAGPWAAEEELCCGEEHDLHDVIPSIPIIQQDWRLCWALSSEDPSWKGIVR